MSLFMKISHLSIFVRFQGWQMGMLSTFVNSPIYLTSLSVRSVNIQVNAHCTSKGVLHNPLLLL